MRNLRLRTKILLLIFLTCSVTLSFTYESILRKIGNFLIYEQKPQKADVIVVLNGRDTERALAAADLYDNGYAHLIVLGRGSNHPATSELLKRARNNFDRRIFFQRVMDSLSIPNQSFKLIGNSVTSTYDEAKVTEEFLLENDYESILLVTSKWHSKRAFLTFKSVFSEHKHIHITISPTKYDTFNPNFWWQNAGYVQLVIKEYAKFLYYITTLKINFLHLF